MEGKTMPVFLTEAEVEQVLTMPEAIEAEALAFQRLGQGRAQNPSRQRIQAGPMMMRVMSAWVEGMGLGLKVYNGLGRGQRFAVLLFDETSGELEAVIEARRLTQVRTGAATGLATRYMAPAEATSAGILGSGWQAAAQLEAVCCVRPIREARVYSRTPSNREAFARDMTARLSLPVLPVGSPREAVTEADVVVAITTADRPLFKHSWLRPGSHVNAAGRHVAEVDLELVRRARRVAVDDLAQAKEEAGDLAQAVAVDWLRWDEVADLGQVVNGAGPVRSGDGPSLFVSLGVAVEDIAVARLATDRARQAGLGQPLPRFIFG
jgi:ornithine cyclodeaminase/alanine dehydrogenase-like protein (mu-crystallin family)